MGLTGIPANRVPEKPEIAVLYHLARTGGTLISKCLGCMEGNLLLSEVNPIISVAHPLIQVQKWHEFFNREEREQFEDMQIPDYLQSIKRIHNKSAELNQDLIIRDWTHVDFTGIPFNPRPSFQLSQARTLEKAFRLNQIATVRHPLDSYLSLKTLVVGENITPEPYLLGCRRFASIAKRMGFVRFEDFCRAPETEMQKICAALKVNYREDFLEHYADFNFVTGSLTANRTQQGITLPPRRKVDPQTERAFLNSQAYQETLALLGYTHD